MRLFVEILTHVLYAGFALIFLLSLRQRTLKRLFFFVFLMTVYFLISMFMILEPLYLKYLHTSIGILKEKIYIFPLYPLVLGFVLGGLLRKWKNKNGM